MRHACTARRKITDRFSVFHDKLFDFQLCFSGPAGKRECKLIRCIRSIRKRGGIVDLSICIEHQPCIFLIQNLLEEAVFLKVLGAHFQFLKHPRIFFKRSEIRRIFFICFLRNVECFDIFHSICQQEPVLKGIHCISCFFCKEIDIFFKRIRTLCKEIHFRCSRLRLKFADRIRFFGIKKALSVCRNILFKAGIDQGILHGLLKNVCFIKCPLRCRSSSLLGKDLVHHLLLRGFLHGKQITLLCIRKRRCQCG